MEAISKISSLKHLITLKLEDGISYNAILDYFKRVKKYNSLSNLGICKEKFQVSVRLNVNTTINLNYRHVINGFTKLTECF